MQWGGFVLVIPTANAVIPVSQGAHLSPNSTIYIYIYILSDSTDIYTYIDISVTYIVTVYIIY